MRCRLSKQAFVEGNGKTSVQKGYFQNLDPDLGPGPWKSWTLKNLEPEKPGLRHTLIQKNLDPEKPGPRKTWTKKNLDPEKPGP